MKHFILRPYQSEAVDCSVEYLHQTRIGTRKGAGNGIVVLPTGSGKSLVIANVVRRLDGPALVFQPSKEILEQNVAKMRSYGYKPGVYSASVGQKKISKITFATIGSVRKCPELFEHFKYLLIDECHFVNAKGGMYRDFITAIGGARILGFTATPYRLASNSFGSQLRFLTRTRPKVFKDVVYYCQNSVLFEKGHLANLHYTSIGGFDRGQIGLNSSGSDFSDQSISKYYRKTGFIDRIIDETRKVRFLRKNCLVFTQFIKEAEAVAAKISRAAVVTGKTPKKERERIISEFVNGSLRVVCNVGVLATGFDFPELETAIIAHPTMSLARYYQEIGRIIRPHPNKEFGEVIDMCGNLKQFGRIEDLKIVDGGNGKWFIESLGRQLTNVNFGESKQRYCKARAA